MTDMLMCHRTGEVDYRFYIEKMLELGIEENCKKSEQASVVGIEMGEPRGEVNDPDR